jgi:DMSO/TMAO reductase YedYZ molybdopterin-dependent catalytic subunit
MSLSRRDFLVRGGTVPFLAASLNLRLSAAEPERPSFPGMIVRATEPQNLEFPFVALDGFLTPNEQFYVRNHFAAPKIDVKAWKLSVTGAVKQPLELTYDELLKLPTRTLTATLECAGNGRAFLVPPVNGVQWGAGAVSNAEWSGVPLAAILEKAGLKDSAVEVVLEGADKGPINSDSKSPGPINFARSLPLAKANSEATLLAYKMNGADLPAAHGAPLRAVVGGWYGMAAVKWLTRIIVAEKPFGGFFQTLDYATWERRDGLPSLVPLAKMQVKSAVARPGLAEVVPAGKPYRVFGAAWAGEAAVAKVEVSTDGGATWAAAKLLDKPAPLVWSRWELIWNVPVQAGPARLMARATDADGNTQPAARDSDRRNYMVSHIVPVEVTVR